jgi:hypothetical protein
MSLEALAAPDGELWRQAADEEMAYLLQLGVYEHQVDVRADTRLLKCKRVLKKKRNQEGSIERYKARLVAKGFSQRKGVEYEEVFASVARHATLRALLAHVAICEDVGIYYRSIVPE